MYYICGMDIHKKVKKYYYSDWVLPKKMDMSFYLKKMSESYLPTMGVYFNENKNHIGYAKLHDGFGFVFRVGDFELVIATKGNFCGRVTSGGDGKFRIKYLDKKITHGNIYRFFIKSRKIKYRITDIYMGDYYDKNKSTILTKAMFSECKIQPKVGDNITLFKSLDYNNKLLKVYINHKKVYAVENNLQTKKQK
jgi:hypothetical protein